MLHLTLAGMRFFPGYVNEARRELLDEAAFRWHQTGQQQKRLMKWGDKSQLQGGMLMLEAPTSPKVAQKGRQSQHWPLLPPKDVVTPGGSTRPDSSPAPVLTGMLQREVLLYVCC